ncbi:MAG: disulfide bond formation protein B [Kiloniellales bacterium]
MNALTLEFYSARPRRAAALAVAIGLAALAIALASQYWGGLQPCVLCIYQRYAYAVAIALGLVALVLPERLVRCGLLLVALTFLGGAAIAGYHIGVEQGWWQGTTACSGPELGSSASPEDLVREMLETPIVRCDEVSWSLFGISMAGYNFLASLVFAAATLTVVRKSAR